MHIRTLTLSVLALAALTDLCAAENIKLRVAAGAPGSWETTIAAVGKQVGIFDKHGIDLDIVQASGSGETIQILAAGSTDIGIGTGFAGIAGAYLKGAPIRIIGTEATGATEFWYVRADSPIKSITDATVKSISYSTKGSSTYVIAAEFVSALGAKGELVATGGQDATLTAVMSGQVDVGWSSPPSALTQIQAGEIRVVARGSDVPSGKEVIRVVSASKKVVDDRPGDIAKFMDAYRETIDYLYTNSEGPATFAKIVGVSPKVAEEVRDKFVPRAVLDPDRRDGYAAAIQTAVKHKFIPTALTDAQLSELVVIPKPSKP